MIIMLIIMLILRLILGLGLGLGLRIQLGLRLRIRLRIRMQIRLCLRLQLSCVSSDRTSGLLAFGHGQGPQQVLHQPLPLLFVLVFHAVGELGGGERLAVSGCT